jgi:uncharacterized membrane protein (UPF0127 family)
MKKIIIITGVIVAVAIGGFFATRMTVPTTHTSGPVEIARQNLASYPHANISLGGETFDAFVADTDERKEQGLSDLSGLGAHEAMIFPYAVPDSLAFWMKDMLFSIDMLWIGPDNRAVTLEQSVSPDSYPQTFESTVPASAVIEFPAGTLARLQIKIGDLVSISYR